MIGFTVREDIGIGDKVQFSSLPENYFYHTGEKLVDKSECWVFDHNPYVVRGVEVEKVIELWNFPKIHEWPNPNRKHYTSNAEIHALRFGAPAVLKRPRLYWFEEGFVQPNNFSILVHAQGRSHGALPNHVLKYILQRYGDENIVEIIGPGQSPIMGVKAFQAPDIWTLAAVISKCRMFIGVDSGPAWIAACYPYLTVKRIRTLWQSGYRTMHDWIPLEVENYHSHWDDESLFQTFNITEGDVGFAKSYLKL